MKFKSLVVATFVSCILASGASLAVPASGITIESGKNWRIETNTGKNGGWLWEGGGKGGKSATREGAIKAAKNAAREARKAARKARRNGVIADSHCDIPGSPDC